MSHAQLMHHSEREMRDEGCGGAGSAVVNAAAAAPAPASLPPSQSLPQSRAPPSLTPPPSAATAEPHPARVPVRELGALPLALPEEEEEEDEDGAEVVGRRDGDPDGGSGIGIDVDRDADDAGAEREATELRAVGARRRRGGAERERAGSVRSASTTTTTTTGGKEGPIGRFWRRQVCVVVAAGGQRDHLALERTFLGYLRTSLALSMTGVMIAQLFRLQHSPSPDPALGFFVLGVPLAATFIGAGLVVVLLGAWRFWRLQNALVRGKAVTGGWEILGLMGGFLALCVVTFALVVVVDVRKERRGE